MSRDANAKSKNTRRETAIEISVVAPCYNEMENVVALVDRLRTMFEHRGVTGEIVLINDASKDDTGRIIDSLQAQFSNVVALHHEKNQGIAGGWQTGVAHSSGQYVCLIDSDLQYLPEEVWRLYRELVTSRADMVQGARSTIERLRDARYLYSKGLNVMLNTLFGMSLRDNKSGFVIARKDAMEDILRHRFRYFYFNTFIAIAAHWKGYTVKEVETLFQNRNLGKSYINSFPLVLIAKVFVDLFKALIEYRGNGDQDGIFQYYLNGHQPTRTIEQYTGWRRLWFEAYFLTMPLHHWMITANARFFYDMLKQSEWLTPAQMKELQEMKLQRLIRHVYHHVPYYHELFERHDLLPEDIKTLEDLAKLPMLSKSDVRKNLYFDLFADNHRKKDMLKISTSGSTGEPFVTYADRRQLEMRWATTLRAAEWTGWRFGDKTARLWHQTLGMTPIQVFRERVDAWFMRRLFIPAYEMRDDNLKELFQKLKRHQPVLVDGYAESFNFLAHYLKQHKIEGLYPKAIMSSAQILPAQVRRVIEEQFRTQVYDKYGSREFSGIAYECGHQEDQPGAHHVMAESYIVEIIKDGRPAKPGEVGEVVITDLNNFSVPLIRYRIGDLAVAMDNSQPCPCGRGLPRIGEIEGRAQAIVLCSNGTWLPGTFFAHLFKDYDYAIRQYQVVQHEKEAVEIRIVPEKQYSPQVVNEILQLLRQYMGQEMRIDLVEVDEIPMVRTGKRTGIVSTLQFDFQALADRPAGESEEPILHAVHPGE